MVAADLFYYTASVFLIVVLAVWLVIAYRIFMVLRSVKKGVEEVKQTMNSSELLKKSLTIGAMMIAGKVFKGIKNKFK